MASITIRNLDERTKDRLRVRAAHGKRSMEEEARQILRQALAQDAKGSASVAQAIRRRTWPAPRPAAGSPRIRRRWPRR